MKRRVFLLLGTIFMICYMAGACSSPKKQKKENETETAIATSVVFDKETHDFGKISATSGKVECSFTFTNKGKTPLVITNVSKSCGCTDPEWSKEPIAPGKQGFIKVTYDPTGNNGPITKHLTVYSNGNPDIIRLKIQGEVVE